MQMKTNKCRVCGASVGLYGWNKHVEKHKREYCRMVGRSETDAWRVNWEDVVMLLNPENAKESRCLMTREQLSRMRKDKSLEEYTNEG